MNRIGLLAFVAAVGCGGTHGTEYSPDAIQIAQECASSRLDLQIEAGGPAVVCAEVLPKLEAVLEMYEGSWGGVNLAGWVIRLRPSIPADGQTIRSGYYLAGETYFQDKTVDVVNGVAFVHELRHIQQGVGSTMHLNPDGSSWSCDFGPWEVSEGFQSTSTESGYLPVCH